MQDGDGQVGGPGNLAVAREERRIEVVSEYDIDSIVDDEVVAVAPGFNDERLGPGYRDGQSEDSGQCGGGASFVDVASEEHPPDRSGGLDVKQVGHPPRPIAWCKGEQASTEPGSHHHLSGS